MKFNLPIIEVVKGGDMTKEAFVAKDDGIMVNSGFMDGMTVREAIPAMKKYCVEHGIGKEKVNYKLRDWVFSRQRYWGEPIPLVYCDKCGWVPLDESELPLVLPNVESYEPTDDGESPLAKMTDWVNTTCPKCGAPAKRETDTMPNWAGSCWYYPVDWYNGGMEHTTLHLLYSRFWHKFLYDIGAVHTKEPYAKRTSHGMILGRNPHYVGFAETEEEKQALIDHYGSEALRPSVKMSKSLGNVVNPDDVIREYGTDTMRVYIMFIGDFEKTATWSDEAVKGSGERGSDSQDNQKGRRRHSRAQDEHRHRRADDPGEPVLCKRLHQGRSQALPSAAQPLCPAPGGGDVGTARLCCLRRQNGHADVLARI